MLRRLDGVRCTNARAVLAGLESFGPRSRKLNNGVLLAAPNASFLAARRRDYADYRPATWDYNSCQRSYALAQARPETVEMQRRLGPLPIAVAQYAGFMARTPVLHVTGLFNAPWRQEGVRATGLLRAVLKAVGSCARDVGEGEAAGRCAGRVEAGGVWEWRAGVRREGTAAAPPR